MSMEFFLKTFRSEGLSAWPGAGITDDLVKLIVNGEGGSIRFDDELVADIACGHAITVTIERQSEIFMHECLSDIAIIGKYGR